MYLLIGWLIILSILYFISTLFRYAFLGNSGTKLQRISIVVFSGIVAIGLSAFGEGTDSFINRITNIPNMAQIVVYSVSALLVAIIVWFRADDAPPQLEEKKSMVIARGVALAFSIPIILLGLGNISASIYILAVNGQPTESGRIALRTAARDVLMNGDMGPFWQVLNERAPQDMDSIIERVFPLEGEEQASDDIGQILNQELMKYRVSLAQYGYALNDQQRKEILQSGLEILKAFLDQPELCTDFTMTGGRNIPQDQLLSKKDLINWNSIITMESLLDARQGAASVTAVSGMPTEQDYSTLEQMLYQRGVPDDQLQAVYNQDASHSQYCQALIAYFGAVIDLEGPSGEAIRSEEVQIMVSAIP